MLIVYIPVCYNYPSRGVGRVIKERVNKNIYVIVNTKEKDNMKKIFRIIPLLLVLCVVLVGCGVPSVAPNGDEKVSLNSYEDILNEYSKKLREATPVLIEEYTEAAKNNQDGLTGLATLCNEKVSELAKISTDGTQAMATLHLKKGSGSYEEYSEWAGKLQAVYMEEAAKIQDVYMKSAR